MESPVVKNQKMELLQSPPTRLLLNESPERLCRQSNVWLDLFDYWDDELRFFNNLLSKKLFQYVSEKERAVLVETLDGLVGAEFSALKARVKKHEHQLVLFLTGNDGDEGALRNEHNNIASAMNAAERHFKALRSLVLNLGQMVAGNFFNGNETLQVIHERRAVRRYLPDPVDHLHIQGLLRAACMAPSALNLQPWKFYILTDRSKIKKYAQAIKLEVAKVYSDVLGLFAEEEDPIFHGAPLVIFITMPSGSEWGGMDTGFCAQNLMLAAKSMGYDTCPVGLATYVEKTPEYEQLGIPSDEKIMIAVIVGKGAECPMMHERKTGNVRFIV